MFKLPKWRQSALWSIGLPALVALNLHRDVSVAQLHFDWTAAKRQDFSVSLLVAGTIESANIVTVKVENDGAIVKVGAQEGQPVRAGQVIVEFSRAQLLLELEHKGDQYLAIDSEMRRIRKKIELQKKGPRAELMQDLEASKEKMEVLKGERQEIRKRLEALKVRAPVSGMILTMLAKEGDLSMVGEKLFTIADSSKFILRATVEERMLRKAALGQEVKVTADAFPLETLKGTIKSIGANGLTVIDIVDFKKLPLKHSSPGHLMLTFNDISNALAIPVQAVHKKSDGEVTVTVRNKFGWVRERTVTIGRVSGEVVQVVKGLEDGEAVGVAPTDTTEAGVDGTDAGGDSSSIVSSSRSKNKSNLDHSLTNKP